MIVDCTFLPRHETFVFDFGNHVYCLYVVSVEADHSDLHPQHSALAVKTLPYCDTLLDTITMIRSALGAVDLFAFFVLEKSSNRLYP